MTDVRTSKNTLPIALLLGALIIAAGLALFRSGDDPKPSSTPNVAAPRPPPNDPNPNPNPGALPMGHPSMAGADPQTPEPQAALTWVAPSRWVKSPNASPMRIATYRVPHAEGDAEDAELSVVRAGGDTDANIARWLGQFDEVGRKSAKRTERVVAGLQVVVVEVQGAYVGMGTEPRPGFAMLSAIVDTGTTKHFFKMTGPAKSVLGARAEFDALVDSIKPS